jgi:opacity protein-like surface antigen
MNRKDRRSAQRKLAFALAAAGFVTLAHAETSPWYVGARETVTRDSNVYRTPDATGDTIFTTGIFGGLDQYLGRQHLRADLAANYNKYNNVDALNHTDGSAGLKLDWETIEHLSGDLQLNHQRQLYRDFAQSTDANGRKVLLNTTDAAFNARLGVVTAWTIEGGVFGSRTRFSAPLQDNNINYDGWRGGVRFAPSSLLQLGVAYRRTNGDYPDAAVSNDFHRNDVDFTVGWNPNDISSFAGRISRTKLTYPTLSERSNSLTTGELSYRWHPGGRTSIDTTFTRDSTAGQSVSDLAIGGQAIGTQHSSDIRVANTLALAGHYELTGKIQLGLDLRRTTRSLDNTLTNDLIGLPPTQTLQANDTTSSLGLNANYDFSRTIRFACGFTHMKRTVGGPDAASLTYPYSVNLTSCSAQVAIQP